MDGRAPFARRAAAYGIDYVIIAGYALGLAVVTITLAPGVQLARPAGYALALATLTLPVVLVFSAAEAAFGATPGKAILGLRVTRADGESAGFGRSAARNALKFLPWELAHVGIWLTPGQPFLDPPGAFSLLLMNAAMGAVLAQAALIAVFGAGAHDWAARVRVRTKT